MHQEEKVAYIQAQAACAVIEAMGMFSENISREAKGETIAHGPDQFRALIERYGIHHNAILSLLEG